VLTPDDVQELAEAAVAEWMTGWTEPIGDPPKQYRITIVGDGVYAVTDPHGVDPTEFFKVAVTVKCAGGEVKP